MTALALEELGEARELERWLLGYAFARSELRRTLLKRLCTCGHWIDGGEPYRYQVWRLRLMAPGELEQRSDCEFCARVDLRG